MMQTFMNTKSFQVVITVTIAACIVGMITAVYNFIKYRQLSSSKEITSDTKKQMKTAQTMSLVTGIISTIALIVVVAILTMNLNKSSCMDQPRDAGKPEIGTAKDLAELFTD